MDYNEYAANMDMGQVFLEVMARVCDEGFDFIGPELELWQERGMAMIARAAAAAATQRAADGGDDGAAGSAGGGGGGGTSISKGSSSRGGGRSGKGEDDVAAAAMVLESLTAAAREARVDFDINDLDPGMLLEVDPDTGERREIPLSLLGQDFNAYSLADRVS